MSTELNSKDAPEEAARLETEAPPVSTTFTSVPPLLPDKGDIAELRRHIALLIQSNERLHEMGRRQMFSVSLRMSLLRGIMLGFGWVLGTTVVVAVVLYFMRPFLSVPYIGEATKQLLQYIEHSR